MFSIVVKNNDYDNINENNVIQYCNIFDNNDKKTSNTQLMMKSLNRNNAMRIIRFKTINNKKKTMY